VQWIERITNAGVSEGMPHSESRHIRALNALGVLLSLQSLGYVPLLVAFLPSTVALLCAVAFGAIGWGSVPFANARGHTDAARWIALTAAVVQVGGVSLLCGRDALVHIYFTGGVAFAFTVFPRNRVRGLVAYASTCALLFVLLQVFAVAPLWPLPDALMPWMRGTSLGGMLLFILMVSFNSYREIARADDDAAAAHVRSETLLLRILPGVIAERLKLAPGTLADGVPAATVLFADIVGFTKLSQTVSPAELVRMLDDIFTRFDRLLPAHGLEKIKTIGDAYMAVSGVPDARPDHAPRAADMALAMQDLMEREIGPRHAGLQLRIGLHTGPLVAGVIGKTRFAYDVWGDTVNTASRMESHGAPGRIQVSRELHDALGADYRFEARGAIEVKGKGPMELFFLDGRA
jgi:class 3 adenylate cyclase